MRAKLIVVFLLWSAISAKAQIYGLNPISTSDITQGPSLEVTNIPPTMSQDTLGICFAYVSSTLLTSENCRALKTDCTHIPEGQIFSPVHLAQLGRVDEGKGASGVNSSDEIGGSTANVLQMIAYENGQAAAADCASLDKVLSKVGGAREASEMQLKIWENLQKSYNKLHKAAKDIDPECPTCVSQFYSSGKDDLDELDKNFNLNKTNKEVLKAFAQDSYGAFLDQLLVPKECKRLSRAVQFENLQKVKVEMYPQPASNGKSPKGNYAEAMTHIKDALKDGRPLSLGNLCLDQKPSENKCENLHGVVISGYRKVCNAKNECYDAVKVINSWGQSWQDANNQGWLDAKTLLDRTFYKEATLSWFSDRK